MSNSFSTALHVSAVYSYQMQSSILTYPASFSCRLLRKSTNVLYVTTPRQHGLTTTFRSICTSSMHLSHNTFKCNISKRLTFRNVVCNFLVILFIMFLSIVRCLPLQKNTSKPQPFCLEATRNSCLVQMQDKARQILFLSDAKTAVKILQTTIIPSHHSSLEYALCSSIPSPEPKTPEYQE